MLRLPALALALWLLGVGCQGSAVLTPVRGKVTYRGVALKSGIVVFTPDATRGERGPIARGTIQEDGTYVLMTVDAPGAGPGWYRITVAGSTAAAAKTLAPAPPTAPLPVLPDKYRDPEFSLLRCQVKADQTNTIDLVLD
jgi:hypothetical protein